MHTVRRTDPVTLILTTRTPQASSLQAQPAAGGRHVPTAQETTPATGHHYTYKVTTAATCTEDGVRTYTCVNCGDCYTETIPAAGHTPVTDPAAEATTDRTGLTEGSHCSVCGEVLVPQEVVPMKSPEAAATPEPTAAVTPEPTATATPVPTATATPEPTATAAPTTVPTAEPTAEPAAEPTESPVPTTAALKGDLSGDGMVNIVDALRLFRSVNGQIDALGADAADLNGDGKVNIIDALKLFRFVNGQIDTL